jgi:arylsulfatase
VAPAGVAGGDPTGYVDPAHERLQFVRRSRSGLSDSRGIQPELGYRTRPTRMSGKGRCGGGVFGRHGMTTIGILGSTRGIQKEDPTLAEVLKSQGYATGQFGKNHLGDRNEFLPTVHGFDEWFGNLYHLNAEEEPEQLDYPGQKNPGYKKKYAPRGVMHTWATQTDDPTTDPVFGRVGKQKIENTGPLTRKRMETFDGEVLKHTLTWLDQNGKGDKPFFCWFNTTAIHIWSHPQAKYVQQAVDEGRRVGCCACENARTR